MNNSSDSLDRLREELAQLRQQNELLSSLLNSSREFIVLSLDTECRITSCNEMCRKEMKQAWDAEIRLGDSLLEQFDDKELRSQLKNTFTRALAGENITETILKRNSDIFYEINWNPIIKGEKTVGVILSGRNITQKKRTIDQLSRLKRLYASSSKINQIILDAKDRNEIFQSMTQIITETGEYASCWIGLVDKSGDKIRLLADSGGGIDLAEQQEASISCNEFANTRLTESILQFTTICWQHSGEMDKWQKSMLMKGYSAQAIIPFKALDMKAILVINSKSASSFKEDEEEVVLSGIAENLAIALNRLESDRIRKQWADAFDNCAHGIAIGLPGSNLMLACNKAFARLQGRTVGEITSMPILSMYAPDEHESVRKHIELADLQGSSRYETRMIRKDGSIYPVQMDVVSLRDDKGNILYRVATQQDITERKAAEEKLEFSERRFVNIWDNGPFGMMMVDREGKMIRNNRILCEMLGYSNEELSNMTFIDISNKEDIIKDLPNIKLLDAGQIPYYKTEKRYIRKDGSEIWASITVTANFDEHGNLINKVSIIEDITQKRKIAEELRIITDRLKIATQAANIGIWEWDIVKNELIWDDEMYRLYGIDPAKAPPAYETWLSCLHPDDRVSSNEVSQKAVRGESGYDTEFRIVWHDGSIHWLKAHGQVFFDQQGKPATMIGVNYDISLIHETMDTLVESEQGFSSIFNSSPIGITLFNAETMVIENINQSALDIIGYKLDEVLGMTTLEVGLVINQESRNNTLEDFRKTGILNNFETQIRARDGSVKEIIISIKRLSLHNTPMYLSMMIDNTVRKQAERELHAATENFSTLFYSNPTPMAITTITTGVFKLINEAYSKIMGFEPDELIGRNTKELNIYVNPEDREKTISTLLKFGMVKNREVTVRTKAGDLRIISVYMEYILFSGEKCILSTFFDVTERKLMEEELVRNKVKLETALESMTDAIFISDTNGNFHEYNTAFATFHKFQDKTGCSKTISDYPDFLDVLYPDGSPVPIEQWSVPRALRGEIQSNIEYLLCRKDTGEKWVGSYSFSPIRNVKGEITGSVVVARDITEQKNAELALHASEERYRQLVDNYPDGSVMVFDKEYKLQFAAGTDLTKGNINPENIKGKSFLELFREELWNTAEPHFESAFSGKTNYFEAMYKDDLYYFVTLAPLHDPDGSINEVIMLTRNETERKKAQYALMETEALYSTIFQASPFSITLTDLSTNKWVEVNRAFETSTGYSRDELIGKSGREIGLWKDPDNFKLLFDTFMEHGYVNNFESIIRRKDGSEAINLISADTVYLNGRPFSLVIANDISELKKIELEVARQQALLKEVGKLAKIGGWEYDPETKTSQWTDEIFEIYELEKVPDVFVGVGKDRYNPKSWETLDKAFWNAVNTGVGYELELELLTPGNKQKFIRTIANPEVRNGKVVKLVGSVQDITAIKKVQDALRESETRFRQLVRDVQVGVALYRPDGSVILANPKALSILKLSEDEFINRSRNTLSWNVIHPDGSPMQPDEYPVTLCRSTGKSVNNVMMGIYPPNTNSLQWLLADAYPQFDNEGNLDHIVTSFIDITFQKKAEEILKIQSERLQVMHEIDYDILKSVRSPESIAGTTLHKMKNMLDCHSIYIGFLDPASMEIKMYSPSGLEDGQLVERSVMASSDYGGMSTLASGKLEIIEDTRKIKLPRAIRKEVDSDGIGSFVYMPLFSAQAFYGALIIGWKEARKIKPDVLEIIEEIANQLSLALEQAYMISESLRYTLELEDRIRQRTIQLEESNKELEAFSYSVSHDLRAPLRHINGYIEMLTDKYPDNLPEQGKHYLKTIVNSAKQMGTLIDDLLEFSRSSRQELRKARLDMNVLLTEALSQLNQDIHDRSIEWEIDKLPEINGDHSMIRQVFLNLLSNAVKFTRDRNPAKISVLCTVEEHEFVFLVRDNGAGFDMKYAQKLFGVFQRLHASSEFEGTGIGLANVRRIISKHGGRTWAEAEPGKGATFYFSIPKI